MLPYQIFFSYVNFIKSNNSLQLFMYIERNEIFNVFRIYFWFGNKTFVEVFCVSIRFYCRRSMAICHFFITLKVYIKNWRQLL